MDGLVEYEECCREMGRRLVGRAVGWVKVDIQKEGRLLFPL